MATAEELDNDLQRLVYRSAYALARASDAAELEDFMRAIGEPKLQTILAKYRDGLEDGFSDNPMVGQAKENIRRLREYDLQRALPRIHREDGY
jgi:hypothetical protein